MSALQIMLKLEIVTPEKRVLDAEVDSVTLVTASGEAGILPNHAPLVSALKPGVLSYGVKGVVEKLAVSGGFVDGDRRAAMKWKYERSAREQGADIRFEAGGQLGVDGTGQGHGHVRGQAFEVLFEG